MENTRVIEILELILAKLSVKREIAWGGICGLIIELTILEIITREEEKEMDEILLANKPSASQFTSFRDSPLWRGTIYWWMPMWDNAPARVIRERYIEALILKFKSNET